MLADALPDAWGNLLIRRWLIDQGRDLANVSPVERLCFVADRAMGALEFKPAAAPKAKHVRLHVDELLDLSQRILKAKAGRAAQLSAKEKDALAQVILVGSSVGGNRPRLLSPGTQTRMRSAPGTSPSPPILSSGSSNSMKPGPAKGPNPKAMGTSSTLII